MHSIRHSKKNDGKRLGNAREMQFVWQCQVSGYFCGPLYIQLELWLPFADAYDFLFVFHEFSAWYLNVAFCSPLVNSPFVFCYCNLAL